MSAKENLQEIADSTIGVATRKISRLERWLGPEPYRVLKGLVTNPLSIAGLVLIALFVLVAVGAPVIAPPLNPNQPYQIPRDGFNPVPKPPGTEWNSRQPPLPFWWKSLTGKDQWVHILGTASGQWDIYYGIVWGTRTAFRVGLIIIILTLVVGLLIGSVSAYYGGVVDNVLMRITDVFMTFPFLIAALTLSTILTPMIGRSIVPAIVAIVVFGWMGYARLIRGDILSVKERDFVLAAKALGVRDGRILFRHIVPNAIFPTIVVASMDMGSIVLSFSALSFLGIGADLGYADWGQLLSFARNWITDLASYWYVVTFPGLAIFLYVLAWNLVGDAVRDLFDPRLRGQT